MDKFIYYILNSEKRTTQCNHLTDQDYDSNAKLAITYPKLQKNLNVGVEHDHKFLDWFHTYRNK